MTTLGKARGLTLLELLVAFAIMALSLGLLYRSMGASARAAGNIERSQGAVVLAQSLMSLRDTVPEGGWLQAGETLGYTWQIQSQPYATGLQGPNVPVLHEVTISIAWVAGGQRRILVLGTLRPLRKPPVQGQR